MANAIVDFLSATAGIAVVTFLTFMVFWVIWFIGYHAWKYFRNRVMPPASGRHAGPFEKVNRE